MSTQCHVVLTWRLHAVIRASGMSAGTRGGWLARMTGLKVSYDRLEESTRNLKSIQRELEDTGEHQDDVKDSLGSGDMAHAMHDFAHNWNYHRHKLLDKIQAMGEMAETTMDAFKDVDKKLADEAKGGGKGADGGK